MYKMDFGHIHCHHLPCLSPTLADSPSSLALTKHFQDKEVRNVTDCEEFAVFR